MAWRSTPKNTFRCGRPSRSASQLSPPSRVRQTAALRVGHVAAGDVAVERQRGRACPGRADGPPRESRSSTAGPPRCSPTAGRRPRCGTCRNGSAGRADRACPAPSPGSARTGRTPGSSGPRAGSRRACRGCAAPRSRRRRRCGTRRPPRSRPRSGARRPDAGTSECRISPPPPGCQCGRDGWSRRPATCRQDWPPSSLRNSPAGSTPA